MPRALRGAASPRAQVHLLVEARGRGKESEGANREPLLTLGTNWRWPEGRGGVTGGGHEGGPWWDGRCASRTEEPPTTAAEANDVLSVGSLNFNKKGKKRRGESGAGGG